MNGECHKLLCGDEPTDDWNLERPRLQSRGVMKYGSKQSTILVPILSGIGSVDNMGKDLTIFLLIVVTLIFQGQNCGRSVHSTSWYAKW